ncbi:uncharacterized protein LOC113382184 [Ctenocephalides felis]|uniref:uncharacterized protein LOC113382184 n=1 Tax=Ctenocephalides felis TaxID=7515 RepID=UPI000E6E1FE8|nr:uncharacterized protein LOC113382184 [Ctenocephalides felis]
MARITMNALVLWIESGTSDIMPLKCICPKDRYVGAITEISWKKTENYDAGRGKAKVLAISEDTEHLNSLTVTVDDRLDVPPNKVFVWEVIQDNSGIQENKKKIQVACINNKKNMDAGLRAEPTIFDNNVFDNNEDMIFIVEENPSEAVGSPADVCSDSEISTEFSEEHTKSLAMAYPVKVTKEDIKNTSFGEPY